jgi:hypothetical protein
VIVGAGHLVGNQGIIEILKGKGFSLNNYEKEVNFTRYHPGQKVGHYESFFQRANHPTQPIA